MINRFDLIFPVKDLPDEAKDDKLASFVLDLHKSPHMQEPDISTSLLRKYIAYAKKHVKPQLTDAAIREIKKYYLRVRRSGAKEEGGLRAVPISPRQLEGLIRMSEAMARLRLSEVVTEKDAKKAIDLLHYCLTLIAMDESLGTFDIDRIATGISTSQRSKIVTIKEIIVELEAKIGKTIPIDDIASSAQEHGLKESDVEETIERLKRSGDIFEPKHGMIQRI